MMIIIYGIIEFESPLTSNIPFIVVLLLNIVKLEIFNDDIKSVLLFNIVTRK